MGMLMNAKDLNPVYHQLMVRFQVLLENQYGSGEAASEAFLKFIDSYYSLYPLADIELSDQVVEDMYGAVHDLWRFIQNRKEESPKLKVFNPTLEEEGWQSSHTQVWLLVKDMPFIVSSLRLEMQRCDISIHKLHSHVMSVKRSAAGECQEVLLDDSSVNENREALVCFEINRLSKSEDHLKLVQALGSILDEISSIVDDYGSMQERARETLQSLSAANVGEEKKAEVVEFLTWLQANHFTWLGYQFVSCQEGESVQSGLGLFRPGSVGYKRLAREIEQGAKICDISDNLITFSKSSIRSRIHRSAYSDYIVIKEFDKNGVQLGDHCFLGLYTADVYECMARDIPIIKSKVGRIVKESGFPTSTHNGKSLLRVLETLPRDELFLISEEELLRTSVDVVHLQERRKIKLFVHRPLVGGFVHCLVYIPRDLYRTELRQKIQKLLSDAYGAIEFDFNTYFSESVLARTYFVLRLDGQKSEFPEVSEIEKEVVSVASAWHDQFRAAATEAFGEEDGAKIANNYHNAFSLGYQEEYSSRNAVLDVKAIQRLKYDGDIATSFFHPLDMPDDAIRFKIFHRNSPLALSDVLPILENHGLRVIGEHSYEIIENHNVVWLHDFDLRLQEGTEIPDQQGKQLFEESFVACWFNKIENDGFNRLALSARLQWHEIVMLRAYAHYLKQIRFDFSVAYIADSLLRHTNLAKKLVALFHVMFDPALQDVQESIDGHIDALSQGFDEIENLSDDKIFRKYLELLQATRRTNYYQKSSEDEFKEYLSFKIQPDLISAMPQPVPTYEIFVYSPRVEGVHLRSGKVARGGLRWSDRLEDFRTEVLGLVKAQQVKNSVIVPLGAKGGFVPKMLGKCHGRDEMQAEGVECYKMFISGLLDVTDNLINNEVVSPKSVVKKDDDDTYLVVAADKGTATFSDIANSLSQEREFWLDDAFASGGSNGYDHKKMGITAKGAWVSVQQHFREMNLNVQKENFTVLGVGDMGGDVFGNGMLQSETIQLVAAFNHLHIFVDPNPDTQKAFQERQRLFESALGWGSYEQELISKGGGVFNRSAKSITISKEMQKCFDIKESSLTPTEFISRLLKAPVDLIWNGGIGTYVKSEAESHSDAGDKANDVLRVNGSDLRCKVFGEGGNLGMTQLGRVEFCLKGGRCNTDFIDNAAGVDCSDHEVNLKILLNELIAEGDLTLKQRNQLLEAQTDEVSRLVLLNNYRQTQAISLAQRQIENRFNEYLRYISSLEASGKLNRELEFIPDDESLMERRNGGGELTRPEVSVLLSYAKLQLKEELMSSPLEKDSYILDAAHSAFPQKINKRYARQVVKHRLVKEIIATQLANEVVNQMGTMFAQRMVDSTGSQFSDVIRAYVCIRDIYRLPEYWLQVEDLDYKVDSSLQMDLMLELIRLIRRATRWFLRNHRNQYSIKEEIQTYKPAVEEVGQLWPELLAGASLENWQSKLEDYKEKNIPDDIANYCAASEHLYAILGIAQLAEKSQRAIKDVAHLYFSVGDHLRLPWFALQLRKLTVENHWHAMARESYMDDLESQHRQLVDSILSSLTGAVDVQAGLSMWFEEHHFLVERWGNILSQIQTTSVSDYPMYAVALRELSDLVQGAASDLPSEKNDGEDSQAKKPVADKTPRSRAVKKRSA